MQFKCFSGVVAEFNRIVARDLLDGPEVLRELVAAFNAAFSTRRVKTPLVVRSALCAPARQTEAGRASSRPPLVVRRPTAQD